MLPKFLDPVIFDDMKYHFGYLLLDRLFCFDWETMQGVYLPYVYDENGVRYDWRLFK